MQLRGIQLIDMEGPARQGGWGSSRSLKNIPFAVSVLACQFAVGVNGG